MLHKFHKSIPLLHHNHNPLSVKKHMEAERLWRRVGVLGGNQRDWQAYRRTELRRATYKKAEGQFGTCYTNSNLISPIFLHFVDMQPQPKTRKKVDFYTTDLTNPTSRPFILGRWTMTQSRTLGQRLTAWLPRRHGMRKLKQSKQKFPKSTSSYRTGDTFLSHTCCFEF